MDTTGIITKGIGGFYYVMADGVLIECSARGRLRKQGIKPMIGDSVIIRRDGSSTIGGAIEAINPRRNYLIRPPVANVDQLVIVMAAASPQPDLLMVDKLLVQAERAGIEPIICINKTDLAGSDQYAEIYKTAGYRVFLVSAKENDGIGALKTILQDKITVLAGNSGVGKSSILNALGFELEVGEVSRIERGRHTTRHTELFPLNPTSFTIDTPGFSILDIDDIASYELDEFFPEIKANSACRFADCAHIGEDGCAVADSIASGKIAPSRHESYKNLYNTLKAKEQQ